MATYRRVLIWVPAPVDVVRRLMHRSGAGQAAVIPVESGTVMVSAGEASDRDLILWQWAARKIAGTAVAFTWDIAACYPPKVFARFRQLRGDRWVAALAQAFSVPEDLVRAHVEQVPVPGGVEQIVPLLEAVGRPDVARVAELAATGVFDDYRDPALRRYKMICHGAGWVLYWLALWVLVFVVDFRWGASDWVLVLLMAPTLVLSTHWIPRYLMTANHIDYLLPVVELPASESQSARYEANEPRTSNL